MRFSSTARASFYIYNTPEEVDALAEAVSDAARFFGGPTTGAARGAAHGG